MNAGLPVWRKVIVVGLIFAAVLDSGGIQAQVRLGILGGLHSSNILETNSLPGWDTAVKRFLRSQTGFQLGVIVEVPFGHSGFYFQPAITYITKGRQYDRNNDSITALATDTIYNKTSVNLGYVEIPLNVTYKIALTSGGRNCLFFSAGPYVAFFNSGNTTTQSLTAGQSEQYNSETDPVPVGKARDAYKTVDIGLNGRAGFELGNLMLNIYYSRGLTNMYTADYPGTFHNTVFGASLGIWITGQGTAPPVKKKDTDKDGIPDSEDACPLKPGFARYHGCPVPDTDHDGIDDEHDSCPTVAGLARYHGCPIPDRDGDGVNDEEDQCPDSVGPASNHGCPLPPPPVVIVAPPVAPVLTIRREDSIAINYIARNVLFNSSSDRFRDSSFSALDTLAARMLAHPEWHLTIEGHTDNSGIRAKNMVLSQRRADAIRVYLEKRGISPDRLTSVGYGSSRPVADNRTVAGRAANRRVEFKLSIGTR
ncbi:MAG TPA: OmpA family protein [Puia sp.]|nr:OmpA family protein [Puia sp.]